MKTRRKSKQFKFMSKQNSVILFAVCALVLIAAIAALFYIGQ